MTTCKEHCGFFEKTSDKKPCLTESHHIVQADLELINPRLASNFQRSTCFSLSRAEITCVHHHAWLFLIFRLEQHGLIFLPGIQSEIATNNEGPLRDLPCAFSFKLNTNGLKTEYNCNYLCSPLHDTWCISSNFSCTEFSLSLIIALHRLSLVPPGLLRPHLLTRRPRLQNYFPIDMRWAHPISLLKPKLNSHLFVLVF